MMYNNTIDTRYYKCNGCVYYTTETAIDLDYKPTPCNSCSRRYNDHYKSLCIPLENIVNKDNIKIYSN